MLEVVVYWTDKDSKTPCSRFLSGDGDNLSDAINFTHSLRQQNHRHICYSSFNTDMVGEMGVNTIVDGKLPDGSDYTWKKRRK